MPRIPLLEKFGVRFPLVEKTDSCLHGVKKFGRAPVIADAGSGLDVARNRTNGDWGYLTRTGASDEVAAAGGFLFSVRALK